MTDVDQHRPFRVVSHRSGEIEIVRGERREGAIELFLLYGTRAAIVAAGEISVMARHGYDGLTLLCPGVPEQKDDDKALDALIAWGDAIRDRLAAKLPAGRFHYTRSV
jgi:hypothetical protein